MGGRREQSIAVAALALWLGGCAATDRAAGGGVYAFDELEARAEARIAAAADEAGRDAQAAARAKADALARLRDALTRFRGGGFHGRPDAPMHGAPAPCYDGTGARVGDCLDI